MQVIKSISNSILYESSKSTIKEAVEEAILEGADLEGADLRRADLRRASLRGAYLRGASLQGASLQGAFLRGAIKVSIFCKWSHGITDGLIHIGCKKKSIEEWDEFFSSDRIITTKRNTEDFKRIQAVYLAYRAYLTHLKS